MKWNVASAANHDQSFDENIVEWAIPKFMNKSNELDGNCEEHHASFKQKHSSRPLTAAVQSTRTNTVHGMAWHGILLGRKKEKKLKTLYCMGFSFAWLFKKSLINEIVIAHCPHGRELFSSFAIIEKHLS